jgi:hypothetical protein
MERMTIIRVTTMIIRTTTNHNNGKDDYNKGHNNDNNDYNKSQQWQGRLQ